MLTQLSSVIIGESRRQSPFSESSANKCVNFALALQCTVQASCYISSSKYIAVIFSVHRRSQLYTSKQASLIYDFDYILLSVIERDIDGANNNKQAPYTFPPNFFSVNPSVVKNVALCKGLLPACIGLNLILFNPL